MSRPLEKDAVRSPFRWLQRLHKLSLSGLKAERVFSTISPQGTWNPETCVTNLLTGLNKRNIEDKSSDSRDWEKVLSDYLVAVFINSYCYRAIQRELLSPGSPSHQPSPAPTFFPGALSVFFLPWQTECLWVLSLSSPGRTLGGKTHSAGCCCSLTSVSLRRCDHFGLKSLSDSSHRAEVETCFRLGNGQEQKTS